MLIAGGGLAGCLAAMDMARLRPEVPLLLVEEGERLGGHQVWSFLDSEIGDGQSWLLDDIPSKRWPDGFRFFHCVPIAEDRLLVEAVCIAETAK